MNKFYLILIMSLLLQNLQDMIVQYKHMHMV